MSFTALNIEADDHSDDEVDNTKEIQIEEAFRLYQIALNLHKQGPDSYGQAEIAYQTLFRSEIFAYPESITEFDRTDSHLDSYFDPDSSILQVSDLSAPSDDIPNTLPQILYLAYKNYGLLVLHRLKHELRRPDPHIVLPKHHVIGQARTALDSFGKALVWDESDTDLWRSAARIASFLGSTRAARYALEAAAETDDDPALGEVLPPALGEGFAGEQLRELLEILSDEISLEHPSLEPYRTKSMSAKMKKYMDPYPFLPESAQSTPELQALLESVQPVQVELSVTERSWLAIGIALSRLRLQDSSATRYLIRVPSDAVQTVESPGSDHEMSDAAPPQVSNSPTPIEQSIQPFEMTKGDASQPVSQNAQIMNLPNRKRSHSTVGGADTPEEEVGAAKRSKRLRNRDAGGDGSKPAPVPDELNLLTSGDTHLFLVANTILKGLGVEELGTLQDLKDAMIPKSSDTIQDNLRNTALRDFRAILASWDESKADIFFRGDADEVFGSTRGEGLNAGIKAFLEHSRAGPRSVNTRRPFPSADGLPEFIDHVEKNWMVLQSIIILWLQSIYRSYCEDLWSDDMRLTVVSLVTYADAEIYEYLSSETERLSLDGADLTDLSKVQEMIQMLFELRLAVHTNVTGPDSVVSTTLQLQEKDRLARWLVLAGDIQNAVDKAHLPLELELRYHWARALFASVVGSVDREHIVALWEDLRAVLIYANNVTIELQNNSAMPEISAAAAEREISRLTSMDLFMNLFAADQPDPLAVIETLEPILDPLSVRPLHRTGETLPPNVDDSQAVISPATESEKLPQALRDMWKFLEGGKASLRIFLWTRLREAYQAINYTTKVFSCHLKSIEVIVADIRSQAYVDSPPEARYKSLLKWLQALDILLVRALTIALNDATAFEIIDDAHIRSTSSALAHLSRILHCAAIFDDELRWGLKQLPRAPIYGPQGTFTMCSNKLKEMQVRTWALQYTIIKDGMSQNREKFPTIDTELAEYMAAVHHVLGLRKWCKASNKIFLKMMKLEMVRLKNVEYWEDYLGQVLFDLYGIKLGTGVYEVRDHGCPTETLDKRTTQHILPLVVTLANRMSVKDLLKSELRPTIERMQQAIGATRPNPRTTYNSRNYTEYLKSPVNPLKLYEALKGKVYVDFLPVLTTDALLAEHGWFFLQGNIALTKFKSQKRLGPGALDDLKIAVTFFKLQITFTPEHWETWYKMAQCFDGELLEDILWSADKMNDFRQDLVVLQRSSIHCYVMAVSTAMRDADATVETASKLSDLYKDFGMRIYASSREPFQMEAFYLDEFDRHFSGDGGMYKKVAYEELSRYKAWRYAATLFKRALVEKPEDWHIHYMYGKCLWKMYHKFSEEPDPAAQATRPSISLLLSALKKAIVTVPKPRDSRQEPILEPHYKILSIVHKLVLCGDLEHQAGADILQDRPYSLRKGEHVEISNSEEWEEYVLESLRQLRNADKANWHHRMISRNAHIIHDPEKQDFVSASAARHVLCQTMFTKTMVVNVWKPESERPGRHYVYMERYVRYMIKLLFLTNDKANLDQLARRIRKRPGDYFKFVDVWTECCTALYKLIRRHGQIPMDRDEDFKTVARDEFVAVSERLSAFTRDPRSSHPALDSLREIEDLKKLNGGIMKTAPLDDLINDAFAVLYFTVGVKLPGSSVPTSRPSGPMSLGNMMNLDGANDGPVPGASGQDPSRPPKLGISRREILRAAETAVTRMQEQERMVSNARRQVTDDSWSDKIDPFMILPSNTPGTPPLALENRVVISVPSSAHVSTPGIDGDAEMKDADASARREDNMNDREPSSEPGSVHDSADDESDLSDVPNMDDEDDAAIFPDLARPSQHTASTSTPTNPANAVPADMPGGEEHGMVLYTRPATVHGMELLNPTPIDNLPAWNSLPTKDFIICREGGKRIYLNDTVWTYVPENSYYRSRNIPKLARVLDIRTAKNKAGEEIDHIIVQWYWTKQELKDHAEKRISRLASEWPADREGRSFEYMLSNHRDVLVSGNVYAKAEEDFVMRTCCRDEVLLCDGVEPEIESWAKLAEQPHRRRWLERAAGF